MVAQGRWVTTGCSAPRKCWPSTTKTTCRPRPRPPSRKRRRRATWPRRRSNNDGGEDPQEAREGKPAPVLIVRRPPSPGPPHRGSLRMNKKLLLPIAFCARRSALLWAVPRSARSAVAADRQAGAGVHAGNAGQPGGEVLPADMKGKVWLLNVWASWCPNCKDEHRT